MFFLLTPYYFLKNVQFYILILYQLIILFLSSFCLSYNLSQAQNFDISFFFSFQSWQQTQSGKLTEMTETIRELTYQQILWSFTWGFHLQNLQTLVFCIQSFYIQLPTTLYIGANLISNTVDISKSSITLLTLHTSLICFSVLQTFAVCI